MNYRKYFFCFSIVISTNFYFLDCFGYTNQAFKDSIILNNLIVNGSFEEQENCPNTSIDIMQCKNWISPIDFQTPEYLCASCPIEGNHFPTTPFGNCYIRLITRMSNCYSCQEYIQGNLSQQLVKDTLYNFSFYCRRENASKFYTDRWSVLFSNTPKQNLEVYTINYHKILKSNLAVQIKIKNFKIKGDDWFRVEYLYKAKGGEKHITFGVFRNHMDLKYRNDKNFIVNKDNVNTVGTYYLDNFILCMANLSNK